VFCVLVVCSDRGILALGLFVGNVTQTRRNLIEERFVAEVDCEDDERVSARIMDVEARFLDRRRRLSQPTNVERSPSVRNINNHCFIGFEGDVLSAEEVLAMKEVRQVEPEKIFYAESESKSWGLDRIDQEDLPLSEDPLFSSHTGKGVNIYVLDTGINEKHVEFKGRAEIGPSFVNDKKDFDENGHGTHCAGTASGSTFGIARDAHVFGVKVLSKEGWGTLSSILRGLEWVTTNQAKNFKGEPGVISMSLGGGYSSIINTAVQAAVNESNIVVVAAGNENRDACKVSPASAGGNARFGGVITVASSTINDHRSFFSNWGSCVDVFAPGSHIVSAWAGKKRATKAISGTSMATPHVAGVAAVLLEKHGMDRDMAQSELMATTAGQKILDAGEKTPNLLLQTPRYTGPPTLPTMTPTPPPTPLPTTVCVNSDGMECVPFATSSFGPVLPRDGLLKGPVRVASQDPILCTDTDDDFIGAVVLVQRGGCYFFDKVRRAEERGAKAVIIFMAQYYSQIFPPAYYGDDTVSIPSVMISRADAENFFLLNQGKMATLGSLSFFAPEVPTMSPTEDTRYLTQTPTLLPTSLPTKKAKGTRKRKRKRKDREATETPTLSPSRAPTTVAPSPSPTFFPSTERPSAAPTNRRRKRKRKGKGKI